jgi:hypothetical protein
MSSDKSLAVMAKADRVSHFDEIDARYGRAASCRVRRLVLEHPVISDIAGQSAYIFSLLDREDDFQKRLARKVWLLKSTITQTLLEFDDARIGIVSMAEVLRSEAETVPSAIGAINGLADLVKSLAAPSSNPKREILLRMLNAPEQNEGGIAVFAGLQGGLTPGWPADISALKDFPPGSCTIFRTRRDIADRGFWTIVIPGTLRFSQRATTMDLLHGGRASEVLILSYKRESVFVPEPIALPVDGRFTVTVHQPRDVVPVEEDAGQKLDQWANESFWQEVRAQHSYEHPFCERDVDVAARFILFADGSGAFLPEDGSVTEISALLDRPEHPTQEGDRLPRKAVRDLEERDLVALRLSGSGDYLDEVADRIMEREGYASLREDATAWKPILFRVIKRHGEGSVARTARDEGLKLRSATYLWTWASDAVIAPHDLNTFRSLIRSMSKLDEEFSEANPDDYALKKWTEMEHLKAFHHRAASEIRKLLLDRVRKLVATRQPVETVESIHLQGLEAGHIGLLRVSAVDATSVRIPYSRLFHLTPVKVA